MISVLYVDDEPDLLEIARIFLEKDGEFSVATATSAPGALSLPGIRSFDAIIADYQMPDMDGIAFLKEIRQQNLKIPFILFTGRGREEVVIEAINNGADFYLQKGGDPKAQFVELASKIRQAVARRKAEQERSESERRLYDIINFLPDATFAIDKSGRVIAWNRAMEEMTGTAATAVLGKGQGTYSRAFYDEARPMLIDLVLAPDERFEKEKYLYTRRDGTTLTAETVLLRQGRDPVHLWGKASWLIDEKGNLTGAIESIRDITERKNAEESLRESEGRFAAFMDHLPVTAFIKDDRFTTLFVNRRMQEVFGAQEWIGKTVYDLVPKDAAEKMAGDDRTTLRTGSLRTFETLAGKNGEMRIYETNKFRIDRGDKPPLIGGFALDITEQKAAEDALRASESRLRSIIETTRDSIILIDEAGTVIEWNPGSERIFGIPKEEALGSDLWDLTCRILPKASHSEERLAGIERMIRTALKTGVPPQEYPGIMEAERADGTKVVVRQTIFPIKTESGFRFGVIVQDITEEKRAEDAIRESEEMYRAVVENSHDSIYIYRDDRFLFVNQKVVDLTGYPHAELMEMNIWDLVHPDDRARLQDSGRRRMRGEAVLPVFTARVVRKNGDVRKCDFYVTRIVYRNEPAILGIIRDITDGKRTDDALQLLKISVDNSPDEVFWLDSGGNILYVNDAACRITAYSREELCSMKIFELDPDVRPEIWDLTFADLRERQNQYITGRHRRKDGTILDVEIVAVYVRQNDREFSFAFVRDISERRKMETSHRRSEEKFRRLADNAQDMIYRMSLPDGKYEYVSPGSVVLTGYTPDELYADPAQVRRLIHPDWQQYFNDQWALLLKGIVPPFYEYRIVARDGTVRWVNQRNVLIRDGQGRAVAFEGIVTDITRLKETERAVRESEEKFRALVETSPDIIWEIDPQGKLRYISPMVTTIMGYAPDELIGKNISDLIPEKTRASVLQKLLRCSQVTGHIPPLEVPATHRDGRGLMIEIRPTRVTDAQGNLTGFRGVAHDITERRRAQAALAESEELYRKLIATVPDIVVRTDLSGQITFINDKGLELGGFTDARDVIGRPVFSFFAPEDLKRAKENTVLMFRRALGPIEYTFVTNDGTRHALEINGDVLRTPEGVPYGMVYVGRDVTLRKKTEEAMRKAHQQITLLSGITRHDILNNVTVMLGYLALARTKSSAPEMAAFIDKLEERTRQVRSQIEFTRVYETLGSQEPRWQNVHALVANVRVPPGIRVTDTCSGVEVYGDVMLVKVFENLLENSTRHGERVTEVTVSARESGEGLVITCEDNGIGIPRDEKEKIFERGFGKNTGLGLFLAREILSLTGITIRETGTPGNGARFELTVPKGGYVLIPPAPTSA